MTKTCALPAISALLGIGLLLMTATGTAQPPAGGTMRCRITENGANGSGRYQLTGTSGAAPLTGACDGSEVRVPSGDYTVVLSLDGALDRPTRTQQVRVADGATANVTAEFATAVVEIRVTNAGNRAAGLATVMRGSERIGEIGSGVSARLSTGVYSFVVKYRGQEHRFDNIALAPGERRTLTAEF